MENIISWFEIPATDFKRACTFYAAVLNVEIEETEMMGTLMGFLPSNHQNVSGAIVQGEDYTPATDGVLVYLNGGENLSEPLSRVEPAGGKVIVPKTQISPEMGYFAMFIDSERNKMAFHSPN